MMTPSPQIDLIGVVAALLALKLGEHYAPLVAPYVVILVIAAVCAGLALNASNIERTGAQTKWFVFSAIAVSFLFTVSLAHLLISAAERWLSWKANDAWLLPIIAGAIAGSRDYWAAGFKWAWVRVSSFLGKGEPK